MRYTYETDRNSHLAALPVRGLVLNPDGSEASRAYFIDEPSAHAWLARMEREYEPEADGFDEPERCRGCGHSLAEDNEHCHVHE